MRVLVATIGTLRGTGYATRIESMIVGYADAGWEVDLLQARFPAEAPPSDRVRELVRSYIELPLSAVRPQDHLGVLPPLARLVARAAHRAVGPYDIAQAETSAMWPVVESAGARVRVLTLHDDDAERNRRIASSVGDWKRKLVRRTIAAKYTWYQRRAIRRADQVWFVSDVERDRLARGTSRAVVVPNGAGAAFYDVPAGCSSSVPTVTFVGPATYDANFRGVTALLENAWPRVRERLPDVELRHVGRGWEEVAARHGARDRGFVEDLGRELHEAHVVIAPLVDGGGTKIKVLEAMAAARPVVATWVAAEGVPASTGLVVTRNWGEFADGVVALLGEPDGLATAGAANRAAVADCSWPTIWARARGELERLAGT
jgi:glycosyltransferase involved in cell wall biosynthesis